MSADFTDAELISYARIHSTTDRALFAPSHVNRLLALAGLAEITNLSDDSFVAVHEEQMDTIINKIKERQEASELQEAKSAINQCPFCGEDRPDRLTVHPRNESKCVVVCDSCACEGPWGKSETSAISSWNRRPPRPTEEDTIREAFLRVLGGLTIQQGKSIHFSRIDTDFNIFTTAEFSFENHKLSAVKILSHPRPKT
jgi:Lar family restriction alleviation protein